MAEKAVTLEQIIHVVPHRGFANGEWQSLCMISTGEVTWMHVAFGETPEAALEGSRDWLAASKVKLEAGETIP